MPFLKLAAILSNNSKLHNEIPSSWRKTPIQVIDAFTTAEPALPCHTIRRSKRHANAILLSASTPVDILETHNIVLAEVVTALHFDQH